MTGRRSSVRIRYVLLSGIFMRILYDHQSFSGAKYGGVARYFYDLMHNLKYHQGVEVDLSLVFSNNEYLKNADVKKVFPFDYYFGYVLTNTLFSHLNRANSALQVTRHNFDIFHPTYFNSSSLSRHHSSKHGSYEIRYLV